MSGVSAHSPFFLLLVWPQVCVVLFVAVHRKAAAGAIQFTPGCLYFYPGFKEKLASPPQSAFRLKQKEEALWEGTVEPELSVRVCVGPETVKKC